MILMFVFAAVSMMCSAEEKPVSGDALHEAVKVSGTLPVCT